MADESLWGDFQRAGRNFLAHKATQMAAAIAFFTIFSLGPMLIIVISVAGLVWGQRAMRGEVVEQAEDAVGEEAAEMLQTVIANAADMGQGIVGLVIGILTLIIGATVVFAQLRDSLNTVFRVKPKSGRPIMSVVRDRGLAFLMVLVIAALLIASLVAGSMISGMGERIEEAIGVPPFAIQLLELLVSALIITALFAIMFRYLPDARIEWGTLWAGAGLTAALFVIGKFALGIYLGRAGVAGAYGAAGGLILLLLWVYYSAMILLFGAEFTAARATRGGKRIEPAEQAEPV